MMDLDKRIKQELENEATEMEEILADEQGMFGLIMGTFKGGMRRWVILVNIFTFLISILMVWTGYQFFIATLLEDRVFWGVVFLLTAHAQISLKMWIFMEMNRSSMIREVKRLELVMTKLNHKIDQLST